MVQMVQVNCVVNCSKSEEGSRLRDGRGSETS